MKLTSKLSEIIAYGRVKNFFREIHNPDTRELIPRLVRRSYKEEELESLIDTIESAVTYDGYKQIGLYTNIVDKGTNNVYPLLFTVPMRAYNDGVQYARTIEVFLPGKKLNNEEEENNLKEELKKHGIFPVPIVVDELTDVPYWYILSAVQDTKA